MLGGRKHDHASSLLKQLHWLPIKERIEYKILLITYKSLHGTAPQYINDLITVKQFTHHLRSNAETVLTVDKTNLATYGDRAFSISAPKLWNHLPNHIRSATTIDKFKTLLKTYLYNQAFC